MHCVELQNNSLWKDFESITGFCYVLGMNARI